MGEELKKTPLYDAHVRHQGKLVPFAGFEMSVQYPTGITAEHQGVRTGAGLFDVCHMGEFVLRGAQALDLIQKITVNDASKLEVWQAQYSAMCLEHGGIIDDLLVYRGPDHYMLVVNASNKAKDLAWVLKQAEAFDVTVEDKSDDTALLAIQGPRAAEIVQGLTDTDLDRIGYYRFGLGAVAGIEGVVSRTGYTGEDGFELYVPVNGAMDLWTALMDAGADRGIIPAGLGCRDSLRLEMGYALYGNDLDEEHTPLESGLGWITKLDKGEFIGREALVKQKEEGVNRRLVGFKLTEKGFPRHGYPITSGESDVGVVTSGVVSPSLGIGIGMGYVPTELSGAGSEIGVRIRNKIIPAVVHRPPFYTEGSIRR
ncbi:MAG: glycine cleavage system aminomethyltransferase GcvT [Longimicrobiales bacterium]